MRAFILFLVALLMCGTVGCKTLKSQGKTKSGESTTTVTRDHRTKPVTRDHRTKRLIPLYSWYSPKRGDNFATTNPAWAGKPGAKKSPDYRFVRLEGYVHTKSVSGTIPLQSFYGSKRGDNFVTTNPQWRGKKIGEKREKGTYRLFRMEGYVKKAP